MTIQQVKNSIIFASRDLPDGLTVELTATLSLSCVGNYDKKTMFDKPRALEYLKEELRKAVLRMIYQDQRESLREFANEVESGGFYGGLVDKYFPIAEYQEFS